MPFKGIVPASGISLPGELFPPTPILKCPNCDERGTHPIQRCSKPCRFFMEGRCEYLMRIGVPCPFIHPQLEVVQTPRTAKCRNCAKVHEAGRCETPCLLFVMGICRDERCEFKHPRPLREVKVNTPKSPVKSEQRKFPSPLIAQGGFPPPEAISSVDQRYSETKAVKASTAKIPEFVCIIYECSEQGGGPDADPSPHHKLVSSQVHPLPHKLVPSQVHPLFPSLLECVVCLRIFKSQSEFSAHESSRGHRMKLKVKEINELRNSLPFSGDNCYNCWKPGHRASECTLGFCFHYANRGHCVKGRNCANRHIKCN